MDQDDPDMSHCQHLPFEQGLIMGPHCPLGLQVALGKP